MIHWISNLVVCFLLLFLLCCRVAPGRDAADLSSLPLAVVETITQPRAPSTRQTYALKWSLFHHGAVDGWSLGKYDLIVRFLKGARRMNPSMSPLTPSWDLSIVLAWLQGAPLSRWTQSSWNSCQLRQRSWPRSLPSKGSGPPSIFGKRRVPCVRAGLLSRCLETPAWIRAQGSHHALPRGGGEPASTALGGGRSSLSIAVSRKSISHICGPHPELWAALCLPRRSAKREGYLQTEVAPLDSGWRHLGIPISRRAVPPGGEGSVHSECSLLLCVGARRLSGGHLQSCGLVDTEQVRWARCPYGLIPFRVIPYVYSSMVSFPSR